MAWICIDKSNIYYSNPVLFYILSVFQEKNMRFCDHLSTLVGICAAHYRHALKPGTGTLICVNCF